MIRDLLKMGDARLLRIAQPVTDLGSSATQQLIGDMFDTMAGAGGVGLAAPQIGVDQRVIVFGFDHSPRYPDEPGVPMIALVNPWVEFLSDEVEDGWEGCLSIPGLRGQVPRASHIRYGGLGADGAIVEREARGFHARIVQHEVDHLNGVLYPQRMVDMTKFGFIEALFPDSDLTRSGAS
ncbi:peptide deformylase [Sphingomonas aerophila]|jgi:peptide deformylase|uniref:Peptide deformylase n=1 Tax=Sphingomonas aerophila TaxID=1344948 RepID=A0A7W9BG88_9SPHN|nr:peptide deformylase [Sphingomonas aerophila]MBB5716354.1 peptide deformylase [Sphingomonas aerophila]